LLEILEWFDERRRKQVRIQKVLVGFSGPRSVTRLVSELLDGDLVGDLERERKSSGTCDTRPLMYLGTEKQ